MILLVRQLDLVKKNEVNETEYIPPKRCGTVYDAKKRELGQYIFINEAREQNILDKFCRFWLDTYELDNRFTLTVDIETTGLDYINGSILLVSVSWAIDKSLVFEPGNLDLSLFREVLGTIPTSGHNYKFDCKWFYHHLKVEPTIFMDTQMATQLAWAGMFPGRRFALDNVAKQLLTNIEIDKQIRDDFVTGKARAGQLRDDHIEYAARDTIVCHRLIPYILRRLYNENLIDLWNEIERPLLQSFIKSEYWGFKVDLEQLSALAKDASDKLEKLYEEIKATVQRYKDKGAKIEIEGFNPNSIIQIPKVLGAIGIRIPNTQEETLILAQAEHHNDLLEKIIEYRKVKSVISRLTNKWRDKHLNYTTGCIHPTYNITGPSTGRLSSSDPNVQNIEGAHRTLVIPHEPDNLLAALDYSQFEQRCAAGETGEEYLLDAFKERADILPKVKELGAKHNYIDADQFSKDVEAGKVALLEEERSLMKRFMSTDIHRRNAVAVFGGTPETIDTKQRSAGKCVSLDTYVHTEQGIIRVGSLLPKRVKADTYYPIKKLKVLTDEGYKSVESIYYQGPATALKITTMQGREIICSPNHKFRYYYNKTGLYGWKEAKDLQIHDDLVIKTIEPILKNVPNTNKIYYFIGLLLATGSYKAGKFTLSNIELELLETLLLQITGSKVKVEKVKEGLQFKTNAKLDELLQSTNTLKAVPSSILDTVTSNWYTFLKSLQTNKIKNAINFSVPTLLAARQVLSMLTRLGCSGTIRVHGTRYTVDLAKKDIVIFKETKINIDSESFEDFELFAPSGLQLEIIKSRLDNKFTKGDVQSQLPSVLDSAELDVLKFYRDNKLRLDKIVGITEVKKEPLCDLTVPENHTVVYNDIVTHNTIGYALLYGAGPPRIHTVLTTEKYYVSMLDCKRFYTQYFESLPKVKKYIDVVHDQMLKHGYVKTHMGRKRYFDLPPKYLSKLYEAKREEAFRESLNFMFQGANADAIKMAMVEITRAFEEQFEPNRRPVIILNVHDEIVIEAHKEVIHRAVSIAEKIMIACGERATNYKVPIEVSVTIDTKWTK